MTLGGLRRAIGHGNGGRQLALGLLAVIASGAYFVYLTEQNQRAEAFVAALQDSNPARYLDELRRLEGFKVFLSAYREMHNFGEFTPQAPAFLTGRWTMKSANLRLAATNSFALCSNPFLIDYGRITLNGPEPRTSRARYRLTADGEVRIQTDRFGTIPVRIIAYGPQINFLEFTPPGSNDLVHAYRCMM